MSGILVYNSQVTIVSSEILTIKLKAVIRDEGLRGPNRVMMFFQIKFLASTSLMLARGSASTHLVK